MSEAGKLVERSEHKIEDTWKLEDLYGTDEAWEEAYRKLLKEIPTLAGYQGRLGESAAVLLEALRCKRDIENQSERIYVYANQRLHEDTRKSVYQDFSARADNLMVQLGSAGAYMAPELLAIPEEKLEAFFKEESGLLEYRQMIDDLLRQKAHILPKETEELLSRTGEFANTADDVFSMFNNADVRFGSIIDEDGNELEVTHGRYGRLMESRDRRVRKDAFEVYYRPYQNYENTLAALYQANAKKDSFYAKVRHYDSAREASLADSNIPTAVYDSLIEAVHEAFPSFHRYVALRKKLLKVDELHMYDVYAPLVEETEQKIPFAQAKKMVKEGLKPLGEEYGELLEEGFNNRWIDVYENQGKRSGAYSWGAYGVHPYVLLNYNQSLDHVFTLAHEMGHALHTYYSNQNQTYVNAGYRLFVAEVASTCNEALLIQDMLKKTEDKKKKAYLINYFLEQFKGTVFRQTMFAEFEKITHEMADRGESLNAETLKSIYRKLNEQYFGSDMVIDEQIDMEWARIPHFYNSFYVYQYATGFSAAMALSRRILSQGEKAVKDYKKFLSGGCSKYPIELLKIAGVDMEKPEPVKEALAIFAEFVKEMEELTEQM
ncbi:MAG: oligoendopeptidase F [Lachnospiraceae bacterium]|nr:oligoendopeptidase F [Lachnospiraceae bacterium]